MTVDEQALADLLERVTPEPPRDIDIELVAALVPSQGRRDWPFRDHRRRSWIPAVAIAAVVVLVISVVSVAISLSDDHHPQSPASSGPPVLTNPPTSPTNTTSSHHQPGGPLGGVIGPWHATIQRLLYDGPVSLAADGPDLILNSADSLLRIDAQTGRLLASMSAPNAYPWVVSSGVVFVQPGPVGGFVSAHGTVKLERRSAVTLDGLPPFEVGFPGVATSAPVAYAASASGSTLYLGAGHQIAVVDSRNGNVVRRFTLPTLVGSLALSPAGDQLYAATAVSGQRVTLQLYGLDPHTGTIRWNVPQRGPISTLGTLPAGVVVAGYGGHAAEAWVASSADGSQVGAAEVASFGDGGAASVASNPGQTVIGSFGLVCVDPGTGRSRARASSPRDISPLIFVAGHLYGVVQSNAGEDSVLVAFQPPPAC